MDVERELDGSVESAASERVGRLAERFGSSARAGAVFGEAVSRDGVTVVPVARARWGFGSGVGDRAAGRPKGFGGGGGMAISPVGYIELRGDEARFRPVYDLPRLIPAALIGLGVLGAIVRRLVR